ncbi:MAG: YbaK/EbsC family protein [Gammaproteobacteria bacterium]|jgi:Ala-tRNA(Pro) deacylase
MSMSLVLQRYLRDHNIAYEMLPHRPTRSSLNSASAAHVPGSKLAKPVILEDDQGYVMVVIPATEHLKIGRLNQTLQRNMGLATESELRGLFSDCETGAIPPLGQAYQMETVVDDSLLQCNDIYFEAGDHTDLIHIKGSSFRQLMQGNRHAALCVH